MCRVSHARWWPGFLRSDARALIAAWLSMPIIAAAFLCLLVFSMCIPRRNDTDLQLAPDDMENIQWLELLHPFPNVKNLHIPAQVTSCIAQALQELTGERVTEVLPALQNLFFDELDDGPEPVPAIRDFGAARQFFGCPVDIHRRCWDSRRGTWVVLESTSQ